MTNTLWAQVPKYWQDRMIEEYMGIEDETEDFARQQLSTMPDDDLREHLRNGVGWEQVDEHDRWVDRPYHDEARELEKTMLFMDMCHALGYARQAMHERIQELESYNATRADTASASHLYMQRLKMSHDRLAELALQQGVYGADADALGYEDGMYATRQVDIWIRG